ncbi:MAG: hypothetical protein EA383_17215 [Spirochaetaceae bacterium]|nr:MAG: hypothetical protein EA383_17215 [Spirochaetaceae bacterium]
MKITTVADSTALFIRACVNGCIAWAGYSLRFLAGGSETAGLLLRNPGFAGACVRAQITTLKPLGMRPGIAGTHRPAYRVQKPVRTVVDRTLLRLSRDSVGRLQDARVRRLQEGIMSRIIETDCGIRLDRDQVEELSHLESVAWVRDNLLVAAGLPLGRVEKKHHSRGQHPAAARCRVVLPAFLHTLRVHRGWTEAGASRGPAPGRDPDPAPGRPTPRAAQPAPRLSTTAAPLFPEDIARRERAVLESFRDLETRSRYRTAALRQPESELETYLFIISLLEKKPQLESGTAKRLLRRITTYHERRTSWTHGRAAHRAHQATSTPLSATAQRI